jgi:hypothetical protein
VLTGPGVGHVVGAVGVAVVVAQVAAFGQALRRNTVGYNGALDFLVHPDWKPPFPAWLLAVLYTVTITAFASWVSWSPNGSVRRGAASPPVDNLVATGAAPGGAREGGLPPSR